MRGDCRSSSRVLSISVTQMKNKRLLAVQVEDAIQASSRLAYKLSSQSFVSAKYGRFFMFSAARNQKERGLELPEPEMRSEGVRQSLGFVNSTSLRERREFGSKTAREVPCQQQPEIMPSPRSRLAPASPYYPFMSLTFFSLSALELACSRRSDSGERCEVKVASFTSHHSPLSERLEQATLEPKKQRSKKKKTPDLRLCQQSRFHISSRPGMCNR